MLNCKEATLLLSEKQDRPLSTKEKIILRIHLSMCGACSKFGKQMDQIHFISKHYTKKEKKIVF